MGRSSARVFVRHIMIHCVTCTPWRRTPVVHCPRDAGAAAGIAAHGGTTVSLRSSAWCCVRGIVTMHRRPRYEATLSTRQGGSYENWPFLPDTSVPNPDACVQPSSPRAAHGRPTTTGESHRGESQRQN
jgi:hypothetical protein